MGQAFAVEGQTDAVVADSIAKYSNALADSLVTEVESDTSKTVTEVADTSLNNIGIEDSVYALDSAEVDFTPVFFRMFGMSIIASPYTRTQQQMMLSQYSAIINREMNETLKGRVSSRLYSEIEQFFEDTLEIMIFVDSCRVIDLSAPSEAVENLMLTVLGDVEFPCEFSKVSSSFKIVLSGEKFAEEVERMDIQPREQNYFRHIKRHSQYNIYIKGGWGNNALYSFKPALAGIASFYRGAIIDSTKLFQDFNRTVGSFTFKVGALLPFEFFESISIGGSGSVSLMSESLEAVIMYRGTNRYFSETAQYRMLRYSLYLSIFYRFNPYFIRLDEYDNLFFKFAYGRSYNSVFEFSRQRDSQTISRISGELVSDGIYDFSLVFFRQPSRLKYSLEIGYRSEFVSSVKNRRLNRDLVYRDFFPELSDSPVELHLSGIYFRVGVGF